MNILLIIGVVVAAGFVLFSLARGLFYFSQGHRAAMEGTVHENQVMQNKMMMARVKWQAITIILLVLIGFFAAGQ
ncbi:MAG: HIG1 domain-containing protein [Sphingopyxis sp.]|nr:HIG1 domain-containing protein [Sphingopyxis sp.]